MLKILVRASQCCHIAASSYSLHDFASQMVPYAFS